LSKIRLSWIFFISLSILLFIHISDVAGMANPSAVYCVDLGYKYEIVNSDKGEQGICIFSNETNCDAWEFLEGKCGKQYSYCSKIGYDTETVNDGKNSFTPEYAVCIPSKSSSESITSSNKNPVAITDLMNLKSKTSEKIFVNATTIGKPSVAKTMVSINLPSKFDWRYKDGDWLTPIKDQGLCGSCWDFAAVGALEGKINIARNNPKFDVDLSEQDILSCSMAGDCSGGWSDDALNYIKNTGVTDEPCFPYDLWSWLSINKPCSEKCATWNKRVWKIDNWGVVPQNEQTIKQYLIEKGPIVTYIAMDGYFDSNGIYRCNNPSGQNHAVVLVGYNDIDNYWIIRNSWGTWLDIGYYKIGYGECNIAPLFYIDLSESKQKVDANNMAVISGSKSGILSDLDYKDDSYMTLTEDCSFLSCNEMDIRFFFPKNTLSNVQSIDLMTYQTGTEGGFELFDWKNGNWDILGSVPTSGIPFVDDWHMMKFNLCNSLTDCSNYISSGNALVKYHHPSCFLCDQDNVKVDWMYLEASIPTTTTTTTTLVTTTTSTTTTIISQSSMCYVRNLSCPSYVFERSPFTISYQIFGTGPTNFPYEVQTIERNSIRELCVYNENYIEFQWNTISRVLNAPSPGFYNYKVKCYGASSSQEYFCGAQDDFKLCTINVQPWPVLCSKSTTNCMISCKKCPTSGYEYCEYEWTSKCRNQTGRLQPGNSIPWLSCNYAGTCTLKGNPTSHVTTTTTTTTIQSGCNEICNKRTINCQTSCKKCPSTGYKNCQYEWISKCGNSTGYINPGQLIPNLHCAYTSTCILRGCS